MHDLLIFIDKKIVHLNMAMFYLEWKMLNLLNCLQACTILPIDPIHKWLPI